MKSLNAFAVTFLAASLASTALADDLENKPGSGWLARSVIGDALEKHGIQIDGLAQFSLAYAAHNASGNNEDFSGFGNAGPLFFKEDDGFHMDQLHVFVHKDAKSSVVSRVTPTPAPAPEGVDVGFGFRAVAGSAAYFMTTQGFDDEWAVFGGNEADPYAPNSDGDVYRLAIPEFYLDISTPLFEGTNFMIGSWMSPVGNDIGFPLDPPNKFYSHPWAFQYSPAKFFGALASSKLAQTDSGIWGAELGIVRGWNSIDDNNDDLSLIANLRWRSPDMKTWIDIESVHGNEAVEDGVLSNNPGPIRVKSTDSAMRNLFVLDVSHAINDDYTVRASAIYGRQEGGNISSDPGAAPGHLVTKDSTWGGVSLELSYFYNPQLDFNGRIEWLRDDNDGDAVKFNAQSGDYYALTVNAKYRLNEFISLRPEIRYDYVDTTNSNVSYFSDGEDDQYSFSLDAVVQF